MMEGLYKEQNPGQVPMGIPNTPGDAAKHAADSGIGGQGKWGSRGGPAPIDVTPKPEVHQVLRRIFDEFEKIPHTDPDKTGQMYAVLMKYMDNPYAGGDVSQAKYVPGKGWK